MSKIWMSEIQTRLKIDVCVFRFQTHKGSEIRTKVTRFQTLHKSIWNPNKSVQISNTFQPNMCLKTEILGNCTVFDCLESLLQISDTYCTHWIYNQITLLFCELEKLLAICNTTQETYFFLRFKSIYLFHTLWQLSI